jgi:hypothetical protein
LNLQPSAEAIPVKDKAPATANTTTHAGTATINVNATASASSDASGTGGKSQYRLCFSPRGDSQLVAPASLCGAASSQKLAATTNVGGVFFSPELAGVMRDEIQQWFFEDDRRLRYVESIERFSGHKVALTFQFRSTASIFNFLGQIIRTSDAGSPFPLYDHARFSTAAPQWSPCWLVLDKPCKPIISVHGGDGPAMVSVTYAASVYAVPGSLKASYSPDVFTILKQSP